MTRRAAASLVVTVAAILRGAPAAAQPGPQLSNDGRADMLFHSGEKKFDGGDYEGACHDFSESLKLGPKLGTLLNLALCNETTGRLVTAWNEFSHAAAWAAQNGQRERLEFAREHVRMLEPKLPRILLQLPAERPIATIDLDGDPVPEYQWYLPLYLDPGEHRLAIAAPGKKRATVAFRVTTSATDQLVMVPRLQDDHAALAPTTTIDPPRHTAALVGLGLGAAGLVVGGIFGARAMTGDTREEVKEDATISGVAFLAGAVFAVTGAYLLWTSTARSARPFLGAAGAAARF
jgi:hypothetical protein